jgi:hypothetical protein
MEFDVFLSHNSKDKPAVCRLASRLKKEGLVVWLDEEQLQPGLAWMNLLADGIKRSRSVLTLIVKDGLGPWEDEEMQTALQRAVSDKSKKLSVIPVLLPKAGAQPGLPMFLGNRTWVDLKRGLTKDRIAKLVWGITGQKPSQQGSSEEVHGEDFTDNTPNNLPLSGAIAFVGRGQILENIDKHLQEGAATAITSIAGMGGVGKTELALHYARSQINAYPDGVCWVKVRGGDPGIQVLQFALTYFGLRPPETREQALDRMCAEAKRLGANAVTDVRFTTSMISNGAAEILAYGTAVTVD